MSFEEGTEATMVGDPLINAQVGNYQVKAKLGEGGMGAVYMAEHPLIGKRVALKVLHSEFASNEDVVTRFFNEAKAVNDIQHPNIVDIIDYGVIPNPAGGHDMVYFIMEFLNGHSLNDIIEEQAPLAPERALQISIQVADALAASHKSQIVHRDLKPDNIILIKRRASDDFVKLLDFGIAKLTGDQHGSSRTRTGIVMGTPAYMSPEQCEGKGNVDHRTDVYALGVVLYQMLTGRVPFLGEGYGEVLVQHLTQAPERPSSIRSVIPPHVEAICMKALEKRPEARYQSMEDFMAALADPVGFVEANGGLEGFYQANLGNAVLPNTPQPGAVQAVAPDQPSGAYHYPQTPAPGTVPAYGASNTQFPAEGGGKSKMPLIIGGIAAVGIAAGAVLMLGGGDDKKSNEAQAAAVEAPEPIAEPEKPIVEPEKPDTVEEPEKPDTVEEPEKPTNAPSVRIRGTINSDPKGAEVYLDGQLLGTTPRAYKHMSADLPLTYTLKKKGYEDQNLIIDYEEGEEGELGKKRQKYKVALSKERRGSSGSSRHKDRDKDTGKDTGKNTNSGGTTTGDNTMLPSFDTKPKPKDDKKGDNTMAPSF